ncbi:MAG: ARMT1-like domain-containing protein, partial [Desulfovibrionaceae bacterium]|nr:ARMT1-like domain-containing protein [Desulfovibrionaceae bacterium]
MQTSLDCVLCFMRQALTGARLAAPHDPKTHFRVLSAWAARLGGLDLSLSPPALAGELYDLIAEITGCGDLFEGEKRAANERVLELLPALRRTVAKAADPLAAALEVSIIGNFIDCGVAAQFDWESCLSSLSLDIDARTLELFR